MTDFNTIAAAVLILSGATAPGPVPRPFATIDPATAQAVYCQFDMLPQPVDHVDRRLRVVRDPQFEDQPNARHEKGRGHHRHHPPRHHHR